MCLADSAILICLPKTKFISYALCNFLVIKIIVVCIIVANYRFLFHAFSNFPHDVLCAILSYRDRYSVVGSGRSLQNVFNAYLMAHLHPTTYHL